MAYIRGMRNLGRGAGRTRHQRMLSGGDPPPPPPPTDEYDEKPKKPPRAVATPPSWTPEEQANAARYMDNRTANYSPPQAMPRDRRPIWASHPDRALLSRGGSPLTGAIRRKRDNQPRDNLWPPDPGEGDPNQRRTSDVLAASRITPGNVAASLVAPYATSLYAVAESIAPGIQGLNSFLDRIEETIGGISLNPDFDPWLLNYGP